MTKFENEGYLWYEYFYTDEAIKKYKVPVNYHANNVFVLVSQPLYGSEQTSHFLKNGDILTRVDTGEDFLVSISATLFNFKSYEENDEISYIPENERFVSTDLILIRIKDGKKYELDDVGVGHCKDPWKFKLKSHCFNHLI